MTPALDTSPLPIERPGLSGVEVIACTCAAAGRKGGCRACLWFSWRWSDGRPPVPCPRLPGKTPCNRSLATCHGCGRYASLIGEKPEVAAALSRRGL